MGFTQEEIDSLLSGTSSTAVGTAAAATMEPPSSIEAGRPAPGPETFSNPSSSARLSSGSSRPVSSAAAGDVARIVHLPVPVKVELASRSMPLSAILHLTEGSIIDFQKSVDEELLLVVANRCVGSGRAVKVGENFGLRVTRIGSVKKRIEAMGG